MLYDNWSNVKLWMEWMCCIISIGILIDGLISHAVDLNMVILKGVQEFCLLPLANNFMYSIFEISREWAL